MLNKDYQNISYTAEQIKVLLKDNKINLSKLAIDDETFNSIFNTADKTGEEDGKLKGSELGSFLNEIGKLVKKKNFEKIETALNNDIQTIDNISNKYKEKFEALSFDRAGFSELLEKAEIKNINPDRIFDYIQKKTNTRFENDGNNNLLSKQEFADFLLIAKKELPEKDYNKLTTILEQLETAENNKTTSTEIVENAHGIKFETKTQILPLPAVDNELSEAAIVMLKDLGIPIKEIKNGKFNSVQIITKSINGGEEVKSALLKSNEHGYTFEIPFNGNMDNKKNNNISKISYNGNGEMEVESVYIDKVDIDYNKDESESHTFIFTNSTLNQVTNKSGHPVHLKNDLLKKSRYDNSWIVYTTTTNSDTYTQKYIGTESHTTKTKTVSWSSGNNSVDPDLCGRCGKNSSSSGGGFSSSTNSHTWYSDKLKHKEILLGPGTYAQKGKVDVKANTTSRAPRYFYYLDPKTGEMKRSKTTNDMSNLSTTFKNITGNFDEYAQDSKKNLYIEGNEDYYPTFYNSRLTIGREINQKEGNTTKYNTGLTDITENISTEEVKTMEANEAYSFLTETCKLNSQQISSLFKSGFNKLQVEKNENGNVFLTFISPQGYSMKMTLETITQYIEEMEIFVRTDSKKEILTLNNVKGVLTIDNTEKMPTIDCQNVILDIYTPENISENEQITLQVDGESKHYINVNNQSYSASEDGATNGCKVNLERYNTESGDKSYDGNVKIVNNNAKDKRYKNPLD